MCVTFVLFISSDHKITNMTDRGVTVFNIAPQLTVSLPHQGLFSLMLHLLIVEPRGGLVLTRMRGNGMFETTEVV